MSRSSRILLVGAGPLAAAPSPPHEWRAPAAAVLRTWQLARPLHEAGHAVDIVTLPAEGTPPEALQAAGPALVSVGRRGPLAAWNVNTTQFNRALGAMQEIAARKRYDALVAVGLTASVLASRLPLPQLPAWFDLADAAAVPEAQARARQIGSDDVLKTAWARQRSALRRADRLSTASQKRLYVMVGELAALGRLNSLTLDHQFVSLIPPGAPDKDIMPPPSSAASVGGEGSFDVEFENGKAGVTLIDATPPARGRLFPRDAFVILWTGTFRSWNDGRTLAAALSMVMEQAPSVHFACAGGAVAGLDEASFPEFEAELSRTGFRDRCHMLGWVGEGELARLLAECDLGIHVEKASYAAALGAPARVAAWMEAGLPVLTTGGYDLAEAIASEDLGRVARMGKVQELADAMMEAVNDREATEARAGRARAWARRHLGYDATTRPLLRWAADPAPSPDNAEKARVEPSTPVLSQVSLNPLELEAINAERNVADELAKVKAELAALKAKPLVSIVGKVFK